MKIVEKTERLQCDICGRPLDEGYREFEYPGCQSVHAHLSCLEKLPDWMRGNPEFFLCAICETVEMARRNPMVKAPAIMDFVENTDKVSGVYCVFTRGDESAWVTVCNNMGAVKIMWLDDPKNHIEGIYHNGRLRKAKIEVKITLED